MANWAFTDYVIEGNPVQVERIYDAILNHEVQEGSSPSWEGNVLLALGINPEVLKDRNKGYIRGFIEEDSVSYDNGILTFAAQEAWGVTDFDDYLHIIFDDIRVFWYTEEPEMAIYETNDANGKYFAQKFYLDTCINGQYRSEWFQKEEDALQYLSEFSDCKTIADIVKFNETCGEDDYIDLHGVRIVQ